MPQAFMDCVKNGGKVRTLSLPGGKYVHTCVMKGKSYTGEVRKKKEGEHKKS